MVHKRKDANQVFVCGTNGEGTKCCEMVGHCRDVLDMVLRMEGKHKNCTLVVLSVISQWLPVLIVTSHFLCLTETTC